MKRLDSISRSPIYSMFSETLSGASTIRAYAAEPRFIAENLRRTDRNHAAYVYMYGANRWFSSRIALIAGIVILVAALGAVRMRDSLGAGMAGLTLTWVMSFADYLNWIVRVHSNLEMSMNAVERVDEYSEIPQEAAAVVESNPPPSNWPSKGALTVCNLEMRYASDLPPVLQNVSFALNGGEKLGIVGRTGAGKSSLSLALFRIVEASKGAIHIDGLDISKMGLHDLRSRMTIIPQDPVLFEGTVRNNLDPFGQYDDTAIWSSLHDVKFMDSLQSHKFVAPLQLSHRSSDLTLNANEVEWSGFGLDSPVAEGGTNFSQGQRQLLCLTRALLKSSTVTVLDEATASIDSETDANIQQVIRGPSFANTTVLSIAHRLRTVIDYDKILVLDKGCVVQFGPPAELIRVNGVFRTMCMETGEFEELCILAGK
ncbi:P-loop containing nucleoside triphosphate hydrolase protein [Chytriomyces sp. MP71]|nr:P-loop containing nucleoside triphosphate hydrolase protein [Chytriomyces sp. MP71]